MNMHPDFGEWLRLVMIDLDDQLVNLRWEGVTAFIESASLKDIPGLASLLFQWPADATFESRFRDTFRKADTSFRNKGNDKEVAVIAGTILVEMIRSHKDKSCRIVSALSLRCAEFAELRSTKLSPTFVVIGTQYLANTSAAIRATMHSDRKLSQLANPKIEELAKLAAGTDETQRSKIISEALQLFQTQLKLIIDTQNESDALHLLRDEESNALWWMIGQHSTWLERSFSDIETASACTLAGFELASLVRQSPGPFAAPALLSQVINNLSDELPKTIAIKDLANQFPFDTTKEHLKNSQGMLTPVLQIVLTRDPSRWQEIAASIHIDENATISPLDLARQAYDEMLLSSLLDEAI